jgi:phosphoketolase
MPFDMVVLNELEGFHRETSVSERAAARVDGARQAALPDKLMKPKEYISGQSENLPDIEGWSWPCKAAARAWIGVRVGDKC